MNPSGEEEEEEKCWMYGDGELRVDEESAMHFRNLHGIPWINISDGGFRHWVAVNPSRYLHEPVVIM